MIATLKTKHPRKRFQNFRQSCVLLTDRIEIHQSQPNSMTKRRLENTFMFLSLIILTATYCKIHLFIKRHRLKLSPAENQKPNSFDVARYKKITLAVLYIVCFYWLFFAPFVCVLLAFLLSGFTERIEGAYYITTTLILANASINPLLYCWKLRALRQAVLKYIKGILHLHSD